MSLAMRTNGDVAVSQFLVKSPDSCSIKQETDNTDGGRSPFEPLSSNG
jgi:hypothetical protein